MSDDKHSSDDITTDALPNPRTTQNKEGPPNENKLNNNNNEQFHKTRFSSKKKAQKKFWTSAPIINISHSSDVHVGNNITYNFNGNEKNEETDIIETPPIRTLMESEIIISKEDLWFVATHMDSEWKQVARDLGIGDGQISQFIADNQIYGIKEVIYKALLDWFQNEPTEATIGKLCTILWNNNQKDVVKRWSEGKK